MGTIFQVNESNGNATITGSLTMSSQQIHSVADPTSAQDATTKNYVDTIAQGITWKQSVQAATTTVLPANTYSNGASGVGATLTAIAPGVLTIDGYTVALNDRVLIKNEATAANNGIYFVSTLGTVSVAYILTRTLDYDTPADVVAGTATFVEQGTVNSDSGFVQTTTGTITIGTTALSFTQFTGLGEVTAGTGLSKSGNTISLINPVAVNLGGTGLATLTAHDVLVGNGTSNITLISPSTSTFALVSNGTSADPSFQAIVNSITGTSNEITASSSTGSVTLSVPSTFIAPGSIAATTTLSGTSETLTNTTNQLVLGTTNTTTISSTAPSASRTYTIPDAGATANMVLDKGNYTIGGTWTFSNNITLASSKALVLTDNTTNTVSVQATNSTTSWTLKLPTTSGSSNFFLQTDGSGNTTWASGGSGTVNNSTAAALAYYATSGTSISQFPALSPGTALVSDVSGLPANSVTTTTELSYVHGVTSAIQTQLNVLDQLFAYRRPNLVYSSGTVVSVETGLDGTSGDAVILFPDGSYRAETSSSRYQATTSQNAVFTNATLGSNQGGIRSGSVAANTWYASYAVKVTTFTANWVMVLDTILPLQANYATLNTNFGTNGWVYLGLVRYGDQGTNTTSIVDFIQSGNQTFFRNAPSGQNTAVPGFGLMFATTAGATSLTYTYSAGTSGATIPNNITFLVFNSSTEATTGSTGFLDSGSNAYYGFPSTSGTRAKGYFNVPASKGFKTSPPSSTDIDILVSGFTDDVLGVGSNPVL